MIRSPIYVSAPSNIALVKYMGKEPNGKNVATNPSISMTLDSLSTRLELRAVEVKSETEWLWIPEPPAGSAVSFQVPDLSERSRERFLNRAQACVEPILKLLDHFKILRETRPIRWEIRTANSFPSDSGIASSASSFAALTFGIFLALSAYDEQARRVAEENSELREALAHLSREGSGSSGRSFFGPWTLWDGPELKSIPSRLPPLTDLVVLVSAEKKTVSSSEAHRLVRTSPLWMGRPERARARVAELQIAIAEGDLERVSAIAWEDSWEMHSLFHTASPPVSYWLPESLAVLHWARKQRSESPLIVTMDAGPNVHILVPESEQSVWLGKLKEDFPQLSVLVDRQGSGVR